MPGDPSGLYYIHKNYGVLPWSPPNISMTISSRKIPRGPETLHLMGQELVKEMLLPKSVTHKH